MSKTTMPQCQLCRISDKTVWSGLSDQAAGDLSESRVAARYQKGDVIFHEGSPCTGMYNVCSGKVKLVRTGRVGRQTIVRLCGTGAIIAETDMFRADGRYGATAQAMEDVVVCFLPKPAMLEYMVENPGLTMNIVERMAESLHRMEMRVESLATKDAKLRLAEFLIDLSEEEGEPHESGIRIRLRLTREEIAEVIGATLETTIRLVSALRKDGVIADQDGHLVILDLERLYRIDKGAHPAAGRGRIRSGD